jgi:CRP/FNR family transcriptional regulator, cyclic AMP receptor protein
MPGIRAALNEIPLFASLTSGELDALFDVSDVRALAAAEVLFTEGDPADALWVVLRGDVEVSKATVVLAEVGPGAALGELSLFLSRSKRSATARALCPASALRIPANALRKLTAASDLAALKLVNNLAHQMAERLSALNERLLSKNKGLTVARSELRRLVF